MGTGVTVEGAGFAPFAMVTIQFGEDFPSTWPSPVFTDDAGEFAAEFDIPQFTPAGKKTIVATDNSDASNSASSLFLIYNTAPVAGPQPSIFIPENGSELITLKASDVNGDALSFFIDDNPSHGTLAEFDADTGEVVYAPETGYVGSDKFSFGVNDGDLESNDSVVSIHVGEKGDENNLPVPEDQSVSTDEDTSVDIVLEASDIDGDELEFTIEDDPQHGTLEGIAPDLVYTSFADYAGFDSFTYIVDDGWAESSSVGTVDITVAAINDLPVAFSKSVNVIENSQKAILLIATDADGDSLSYTIISGPKHGSLSGIAPNISYVPDDGYSGHDSFKFVAGDGVSDGNAATVSIKIVSADDEDYYDETNDDGIYGYENTAPLASSQYISGIEDTPIMVNLSAPDVDNDNLTFVIIDYPLHGNLSGFDAGTGSLTYTPLTEYSGADSFTFKASDEFEDSETAIVSLNITAVNDPPQVTGQNLTVENSTRMTLTAFDAEGDPLSYTILSEPVHGILTGVAPDLSYSVIDPEFDGEDSFTFIVSDGTSETIGAVLITIGDPGVFPEDTTESGDHETADGSDETSGPASGPSGNDSNDGTDGSSTRIHVERGNTIVQLSWEHSHQASGAESTLNLQFTDRMSRLPLGGHVWYDLVILDDDGNEIFGKQDLIALNSADVQQIAFPENAVYHVEVVVKGVIDKSSNSVTQDGAYTGRAIGTVVVPEFSSALLMMIAAAVMSFATAAFRFAGKNIR